MEPFFFLNYWYDSGVKYADMKKLPSVIRKLGVVSLTEQRRAPLNFLGILAISPPASRRLLSKIWKADRFLVEKLA